MAIDADTLSHVRGAEDPTSPEPLSADTSLWEVVADAAERWGDEEFVVLGRREAVETFSSFKERADRAAAGLWARGVRPGDRVGLAMENGLEWLVIAGATSRLGAVLAPLSTRLVDREADHYLLQSDPTVVVVEPRIRSRGMGSAWREALAGLEARGGSVIWYDAEATDVLETREPAELPPVRQLLQDSRIPVNLRGALVMIGTTGSTGLPKAAVLGHRQLLRSAQLIAHRQGLSAGDSLLSIMPFFHTGGFVHGFLTCLVSGTRLISYPRLDAPYLDAILDSEAVDVYHGVPFDELFAPRGDRGTQLKVWTGGTAEDFDVAEQRGGALVGGIYGMTETGACASITTMDEDRTVRHETNGLPLDASEFKIVDPATGTIVPLGERGELWIKSDLLMMGYFGRPEETRAAIDLDGWLHTGDLGTLSASGHFRLIARLKDVIRTGEENFAALEVEQVLGQHPQVSDVAVLAVPDDRLGEVPVAAIVPTATEAVSVDELQEFCESRLASFKRPRQYRFVDSLPRTDTYKIMKYQLLPLFSVRAEQEHLR